MDQEGHNKNNGFGGVRRRLHEILEAGQANDAPSTLFDTFIIALIITNVISSVVETVDSIGRAYGPQLALFDLISVVIFTVEYIARLWVCVELPPLRHLPTWRARLRFAMRPLLIVDLAAILPFYLGFLFALDLRVLRVLRLLRFFKLARYSPALQTLGRVMKNEYRALFGAFIVMVSLLLFSSTIIYFLERDAQPEVFASVPDSAWWALATLTTVGYGDVVPVTVLGKLFGGVVMIFGLGMFALPIGIIATGFSQEIHRREFVVTWSMVANVPLFSHLNAVAIAKIMSGLSSQSYPAGSVIVKSNDIVDAIYFIAAGEVLVEKKGHRDLLLAGDYFGDSTLEEMDSDETMAAKDVSNCDLLILEREDFMRLLHDNPELGAQIETAARARDDRQD
ncbi:MAG: cyclic nucleotide-gated ion channel/potassium channel family protein [Fimbriimonadaceae bacterium]|nr:cyclic nucleotide-gated ion channel/potassium channel family protein [Alphaproteobacteria bacterium]